MLKNFLLIFFFIPIIVTAQTDIKNPVISSRSHSGPRSTKTSLKPFLIIQGIITKYATDVDVSFGTSISLGVKYLNKFGIAGNVQLVGLDYGSPSEVPVSMELSYTGEKHKIRPFANMQIGHSFSNSSYSYFAGDIKINSQTKGTAFFSPGIGALIAMKRQSGILITLSFINSGSKNLTVAQTPTSVNRQITIYDRSGYRVGIGYKF